MKSLQGVAIAACAGLFATSAVAAPAQTSTADTKDDHSQCFFIEEFQQWRDVDDKTIYIRVNLNDYYRLDMASSCPELTYPSPHLISKTVGPRSVCTALDWDLRVADGFGPGSVATSCIVKTMTKLTPAEAAAIPKSYKPK